MVDGELELGNLAKLTALEAWGARTFPLSFDGVMVPSCLLCQLSANVDVLVVDEEVRVVHPVDTVEILDVRFVFQLSLGFK